MSLARGVFLLAALSPAAALADTTGSNVPRMNERLLLVLTNQVRQDPHAWPGWDTSTATPDPRPSVAGDASLYAAARFHADDMASHDFFSHDSSDGTTFAARVSRYFHGAAGENIYAANFGDAADAMTAWMNSPGHRTNILNAQWTWLGTGFAEGSGRHYYVQDFGATQGAALPRLPAAAGHAVPGGRTELIATYYDRSGRAPDRVFAAFAGVCHELEKVAGQPGNETRAKTVSTPSGCQALSFHALDADGALTTYPAEGTLLAGSGCTKDYDPSGISSGCGVSIGDEHPVIDAQAPGCQCAGTPREGSVGAIVLLVAAVFVLKKRSR